MTDQLAQAFAVERTSGGEVAVNGDRIQYFYAKVVEIRTLPPLRPRARPGS